MYKALKAGYKIEGNYFNTEIGNPQGSVMSPILANILMHKLDVFLVSLKEDFDTGVRHRINPEYRRL
jgi:RNA-directed DNA polymerase